MADSEKATDKNFSGLLKIFPCGKENNEQSTYTRLKDAVKKISQGNKFPPKKTQGR